MGKRTIWTIIILLVAIATASILMQLRNFSYVTELYNDYFETLAQRALDEVSRSLERDEVDRQLRSVLTQNDLQRFGLQDSLQSDQDGVEALSASYLSDGSEVWNGYGNAKRATCPPWVQARMNRQGTEHANVLQGKLLNTYFYHRSLLDEAVLRTILKRNDQPLRQRINVDFLRSALVRELELVGITEKFEFTICDSKGQSVYTTLPEGYDPSKQAPLVLRRDIFVRSNSYIDEPDDSDLPYIELIFTEHSHHMGNLIYTIPPIATLVVIVILSVLAIAILVRQQHYLREREDFVSNMTHELKTPVSSIRLACEMLEDPSVEESEERRKRITQTMLKEVDRLTLLVDQVLQSSSMQRGVLKVYPVELDAHEEIRDLSSAYVMKITEAHGELVLALEAEHHEVFCDKIAFQNIISNIVDNSLKYCKEGVPPTITLTTRNDDTNLIIDIQDNGIGISRQDRGHIFEQFYRVHTGDRHDVKGFGLGLAYVQRAIQGMGGEVKVFSKLGVGTKMSLRIPFLVQHEATTNDTEK
ncbi:MAG: HAMP domain-containing sensor histidine kinase [Porphyromonas sp.]|uniref:sensor histidine kinase n=1 Tax=Porphyromonas sp. TaxID=1924944 RepID=UPI002A805403|nr:HAMP domain-containing sensor histidine kinase [Porphyromonas sp.]MDY4245648.1 HAMP domain-containing sensor histidine kinase [Porphyromonas sp.]